MPVIVDSFTGTNGTELPTYNAGWTTTGNALASSFAIQANGVTSPVSGSFITLYNSRSETFADDQYARLTIAQVGGAAQFLGVAVRVSAGNGYTFIADSTSWRLQKTLAAGIPSTIASGSYALQAADTLYLEARATTLTAKINSGDVYVGTDSSLSSGKPGLASTSESGSGAAIVGDDWVGADLAALGAAAAYYNRMRRRA